MMLERDHAAELFGLAGTLPRPGWVILDAARDHRFTGELVFDARPDVRVYLDRGKIYLAERATDPSLGARLVDAGALNAAQLEHGAMRVGDTEHLGRLFERVPSVDRQSTLLLTELMNDACVATLARQQVHAVTSTPYLHHPSGVHRWDRPADAVDLSAGDPLPAPPSTAAPVEISPPESIFSEFSNDTDALIHWDEPSWLDERTPSATPAVAPVEAPSFVESILDSDWADRLEQDGLPQPGSDPLARPATLPSIHVESPDRFELIWPSGEIDADFPSVVEPDGSDDRDRAGPTARVGRSSSTTQEPVVEPDAPELWDFESTGPTFGPVDTDERAPDDIEEMAPTEDLALAMRRAVASIETGSLAARRRLSDTSTDDFARGTDLSVPGRVATRTESSIWSAIRPDLESMRSVFDVQVAPQPIAIDDSPVGSPVGGPGDAVPAAHAPPEVEPERTSALRRLIGGLRRR